MRPEMMGTPPFSGIPTAVPTVRTAVRMYLLLCQVSITAEVSPNRSYLCAYLLK